MENGFNRGEDMSDDLMERCQVYPGQHVMQADRYLPLCFELLSDI